MENSKIVHASANGNVNTVAVNTNLQVYAYIVDPQRV